MATAAAMAVLAATGSGSGESRPVWKLLAEPASPSTRVCPEIPRAGRSGHLRIGGQPAKKALRLLREVGILGKRLENSHRGLIRLHPSLKKGAVYERRNPRTIRRDGAWRFRNERVRTIFDSGGRLLCLAIHADITPVHGRTGRISRVIRVRFSDEPGLPLIRMDYRRGRRKFETNKGRVHARIHLRVLRLVVANIREIVFAADRAGGKFKEPDF